MVNDKLDVIRIFKVALVIEWGAENKSGSSGKINLTPTVINAKEFSINFAEAAEQFIQNFFNRNPDIPTREIVYGKREAAK